MSLTRALSIALRTLHLAGFALVLGGVVFEAEPARLTLPLVLTAASGAGLIATEVRALGLEWFVMGKGLVVLAKLAVLLAVPLVRERRAALLLLVVVVSSIGAHMPGRFRHASLRGRLRRRPAPSRPAAAAAGSRERP